MMVLDIAVLAGKRRNMKPEFKGKLAALTGSARDRDVLRSVFLARRGDGGMR
jgi:hypothetical protein